LNIELQRRINELNRNYQDVLFRRF